MGNRESGLYCVADSKLLKRRYITAIFDDALVMVGNTGRSNTHGNDFGGGDPRLAAYGVADSGHIGSNLTGRTVSSRGNAGLADDLKIVVDDTGGDVGATQINTNTIHTFFSNSISFFQHG